MENQEIHITKIQVIEKDCKERNNKCTLHFFHEDENIVENIQNRRIRPKNLYKQLFPKVKNFLKLEYDIECYWSQYAGCKCGCSPAFVITNAEQLNLYRKDIYVSIVGSLQTELKFEFATKKELVEVTSLA